MSLCRWGDQGGDSGVGKVVVLTPWYSALSPALAEAGAAADSDSHRVDVSQLASRSSAAFSHAVWVQWKDTGLVNVYRYGVRYMRDVELVLGWSLPPGPAAWDTPPTLPLRSLWNNKSAALVAETFAASAERGCAMSDMLATVQEFDACCQQLLVRVRVDTPVEYLFLTRGLGLSAGEGAHDRRQ